MPLGITLSLCRTKMEPVPAKRCSQASDFKLGRDSFEQMPCSEKEEEKKDAALKSFVF